MYLSDNMENNKNNDQELFDESLLWNCGVGL